MIVIVIVIVIVTVIEVVTVAAFALSVGGRRMSLCGTQRFPHCICRCRRVERGVQTGGGTASCSAHHVVQSIPLGLPRLQGELQVCRRIRLTQTRIDARHEHALAVHASTFGFIQRQGYFVFLLHKFGVAGTVVDRFGQELGQTGRI